ncbi:MAG: hypothetical protein U1G07_05125 [Verrucomicrobiota bacterium]
MIIREAQMKALSDHVFKGFVERMAARLRRRCRPETASLADEQLDRLIRTGVEKANQFGIRDEANLETFLEYTVRHGLDFYDTPAFSGARRVLEDPGMSETEKVNRLNEYVIFGGRSQQ